MYDYDVIVIGGGSGGIPFVKEARKLKPNLRICLYDKVTPSPKGTTWSLGGTCLMSGCIKKKILHYAATAKRVMEDAAALGWEFKTQPQFNWGKSMDNLREYVTLASTVLEEDLVENLKIDYRNHYATLVDRHTVSDETGERKTAEIIILCVGTRPLLPEIPGARELGITSDDLFWQQKAPGRTLIVGASYIALECAGFLHEFGYDVTVAVRTVLLRGFDQQCARMVGELMECLGIEFLLPIEVSKLDQINQKQIKVTFNNNNNQTTAVYDTVLFAVGRGARLTNMNVEKIGIKIMNDKIWVNEAEQTNISNIFALGDCAHGRPELTPVALRAATKLAQRLYTDNKKKMQLMDYNLIPTTVFTPFEHSTVGLTEEAAIAAYKVDQIDVFLLRYSPVEFYAAHQTVHRPIRSYVFHEKTGEFEAPHASEEASLTIPAMMKLIVLKRTGRILGFHYVGPNAGEICQGFAVAIKSKLTKHDLDNCIGIHPTSAESAVDLSITRASGLSFVIRSSCGGGRCT